MKKKNYPLQLLTTVSGIIFVIFVILPQCPSQSTRRTNLSNDKTLPFNRIYKFVNCQLNNLDECGQYVFIYGNTGMKVPINQRQTEQRCV